MNSHEGISNKWCVISIHFAYASRYVGGRRDSRICYSTANKASPSEDPKGVGSRLASFTFASLFRLQKCFAII